MSSCCATRRASSTSDTEQHPVSESPPHSFMVTPTTSWPCSLSRSAATEESTPPLIAHITFTRPRLGATGTVAPVSPPPATDVALVSHHLPKTAGTSLFHSLETAYGAERVLGIYDPDDSATLTNGQPLDVAPGIRVLHGHFRPHTNHGTQFPRARRIIWVRDPIERCWSLLRQWMKYRHGTAYERFAARHLDDDADLPVLFDRLVRDPDFAGVVNVYATYFAACDPAELDFVGRTEEVSSEIVRLGSLLGVELGEFRENVNVEARELPFDRVAYAPFFAADYEFLATRLGQIYDAT